LERKYDSSTTELNALRKKIPELEALVKSNTSTEEEIDAWKEKYHLKADECAGLRGKMADRGAALRALGLAVGIHIDLLH
jgi:hypothetical protein